MLPSCKVLDQAEKTAYGTKTPGKNPLRSILCLNGISSPGIYTYVLTFLFSLAPLLLIGCGTAPKDTAEMNQPAKSRLSSAQLIEAETVVRVYCNEGPYLTYHLFDVSLGSKHVAVEGKEPQGHTKWVFDGQKVHVHKGKRNPNPANWSIDYPGAAQASNGSLNEIMYDKSILAAVYAASWAASVNSDAFTDALETQKVDGLWYRKLKTEDSTAASKINLPGVMENYFFDMDRQELDFAVYVPENAPKQVKSYQITQNFRPDGTLRAQFYNYRHVKNLSGRFPSKIDIFRVEKGKEVLRMQITFSTLTVR